MTVALEVILYLEQVFSFFFSVRASYLLYIFIVQYDRSYFLQSLCYSIASIVRQTELKMHPHFLPLNLRGKNIKHITGAYESSLLCFTQI